MKILFLLVLFLVTIHAGAQFRAQNVSEPYTFSQPILASSQKTFIPGILSDPIQNHRLSSPMMMSASSWNWRLQNQFFWVGSVTSMSYNKGKFGTYYYWDLHGNLRGTRAFIDISGKNKRGFKLVFNWRQMLKYKL